MHFRYEPYLAVAGKKAGMTIARNDGHTGSILNCQHPECVAIQAEMKAKREEHERMK